MHTDYSLCKKAISGKLASDWSAKTADILRLHHFCPRVMTSEERAQKFHTDALSLPQTGRCFRLAEANFLNQSTVFSGESQPILTYLTVCKIDITLMWTSVLGVLLPLPFHCELFLSSGVNLLLVFDILLLFLISNKTLGLVFHKQLNLK